MDFGFITYTASTDAKPIPQADRTWLHVVRTGLANFGRVVITNVVLFAVLAALGIGLTWWVWFLAYLTTFSVFVRVRSMAEHACTEQSDDAFHNTRTTRADVLSRLTVAPHRVNFHLEHHLLMTVPHQNLPRMHALLRKRGAIDGHNFAPSYARVLRLVVRAPVAP
jgi:fatty acid desaturase